VTVGLDEPELPLLPLDRDELPPLGRDEPPLGLDEPLPDLDEPLLPAGLAAGALLVDAPPPVDWRRSRIFRIACSSLFVVDEDC
jgi:hypothetical protein